jgi:hypothetical protein
MQPAWTNADLLPHVCRHITSVHHLAALSAVNKTINNYLFSTTGGKHWISAGKLICGEDYWQKDTDSLCLQETNPRYLTKIRVCPWISAPLDLQRDDFFYPELTKGERGDTGILNRLHNTQWAPSHGIHYGPMRNIIKLHDGVLIITSSCLVRKENIFAYFVSSKDFRLLRDRFYIMEEAACHETWSVHQGILYMGLNTTNAASQKLLRFGIRQDKALAPIPPEEHKAAVIQAFWSAFRGEIQEALHKITSLLGSTVDLSVLTCHSQTLAQHVINGGSFNALKVLLQTEPRCVNYQTTIMSAVQTGRDDMAMLIASKIRQDAFNPISSLWKMLMGEKELPIESEKGMDVNVLCIQHCKAWMEDEERPIIEPHLRLLCSVCARISTGKQLSEVLQAYFAQQVARGCDNGSDTLQRNKAKVITELLCLHEFSTCITQPPVDLRSKRQYFICHATSRIPLNVMQKATEADILYAKDYELGVLFALFFTHEHRKQTSTVENSIRKLDTMLMEKNKSSTSNFISLTETGKVKSFSGRDRNDDFHFRQVFNVFASKLDKGKHYQLQEGVTSWSSDLDSAYTAPEFDVVKKRRRMTESANGENDPDALRQFEEFETSVLSALTKISQDYQKQKCQELLEAEDDQYNTVPPQTGMFYVAVSRAVLRGSVYIPKLGATRRSDPMIRLRELSKNVPYAFELVYCIPTLTPFRLEAEIHRHFDAHRIREREGACTEFFDIDLKVVGEYLKAKYPGQVIDGSDGVK